MALESHSSVNSSLKDACSVAESFQSGEGGGASEIGGAEDADQPSHVKENGLERGADGRTVNGTEGQHIYGGVEGLSTQFSTVDSPAMEDLSEGDEAASSSYHEQFEASELQLIEDALRSLRSVEEGKTEASKAVEHSLPSSKDLQVLQDSARLLKKVQAVKARNKGAPVKHISSSLDGSSGHGLPGGKNLEPEDIRQVVLAAAQTALAAAKTAETVVSSLNRNSVAMEELCKALTNSSSMPAPREERVNDQKEDEEDESKFLAIELQQTEIAKSLVRQNRATHWVLGFIVVSSLVWRYGVIKLVNRVNNTIQNPFQGVTDMFKRKECPDQDENRLQLKLPGILSGEEEGREKKREAETQKEGDRFDLGRIFQGKEPKEEKKCEAETQKEGDRFDLGRIFQGKEPKE